MLDFTVAIRTFNGAKRFPLVLERLRTQIQVEAITWEVLIVDNNSDDDTAEVIQSYQNDWKHCPLRYVFEPQQGASIARRRAIQEAMGSLIGFLDDDNLPSLNWVAAAYTFGQAHTQAGAYSSDIHPDYEVEPPKDFQKIAFYLPVIERKKTFRIDTNKQGFPPGAGLVIRKSVWVENVPDRLVFQGPVGSHLSAKGEDIEALIYIKQAGWEIWHNAEMEIWHHIPKWRLEKQYLLNFCRNCNLPCYPDRMSKYKLWQRSFMTGFYLLSDLVKITVFFITNKKLIQTDTIIACQMEALLGRLFSPFHFFRMKYFSHKLS